MANGAFNINFGCGTHAPQHWRNFDASLRVWVDKLPFLKGFGYKPRFAPWVRRLNVTKPLPFATASTAHIYSSHLIEHLTRTEALAFLRECRRLLKPNGRIRLMTPNLSLMVNDYLDRKNNPEYSATAADQFMEWLGMSPTQKPNPLAMIWNGGRDKNLHQWIYDENSLKHLLEEAGFVRVTGKVNWVSDYPDLDALEPADLRVASSCAEGYRP